MHAFWPPPKAEIHLDADRDQVLVELEAATPYLRGFARVGPPTVDVIDAYVDQILGDRVSK